MKYELMHDSIARQVQAKVDGEVKIRRRIKDMVEREYERHQANTSVLLDKTELTELAPFRASIAFSPEEERFIQRSQWALKRRRNTWIALTIIAFASLAALTFWALGERNKAQKEAVTARATALAANAREMQFIGDHTRALRFAEQAVLMDKNTESERALRDAFFQLKNPYYSARRDSAVMKEVLFFGHEASEPHNLVAIFADGSSKSWGENLELISEKPSPLSNLESVKLWNTQYERLNTVSISADNKLLAIRHQDSISLWDRQTDQLMTSIPTVNPLYPSSLVFHPQQPVLFVHTPNSAHNDQVLQAWNYQLNKVDTIIKQEKLNSISISSDGAYLFAIGPNELRAWDMSYKQVLGTSIPRKYYAAPIIEKVYDGYKVITSYSPNPVGNIVSYLWDTETGDFKQEELQAFEDNRYISLSSYNRAAAWTSDRVDIFWGTKRKHSIDWWEKSSVLKASQHPTQNLTTVLTKAGELIQFAYGVGSVPFIGKGLNSPDGGWISSCSFFPTGTYMGITRTKDQPSTPWIWDAPFSTAPPVSSPYICIDYSPATRQYLAWEINSSEERPNHYFFHILDSSFQSQASWSLTFPKFPFAHFSSTGDVLLACNQTVYHYKVSTSEIDSLVLNRTLDDLVSLPGERALALFSPNSFVNQLVEVAIIDQSGIFLDTLKSESFEPYITASPHHNRILLKNAGRVELHQIDSTAKQVWSWYSDDETIEGVGFSSEGNFFHIVDNDEYLLFSTQSPSGTPIIRLQNVYDGILLEDTSELLLRTSECNEIMRWPFSTKDILQRVSGMHIARLDSNELSGTIFAE